MKKMITATLLVLCASFSAHAQSGLTEEQVSELTQLKNDLEGTYQIEMIDTRSLPSVELSMYRIIADKRDEKETVYHQVSPHMRIKILPSQEINQPDFIPVEYYTHVSSNNLK